MTWLCNEENAQAQLNSDTSSDLAKCYFRHVETRNTNCSDVKGTLFRKATMKFSQWSKSLDEHVLLVNSFCLGNIKIVLNWGISKAYGFTNSAFDSNITATGSLLIPSI